MKFIVIARDPQVDLYREDDFYGSEVVEADSEKEAISFSQLSTLSGLNLYAYEVDEDTPFEDDVLFPQKSKS